MAPTLAQLASRPAIIFDLFHTLSTIRHSGVVGAETHELLHVDRERYLAALFGDAQARLTGEIRDHVEIIADLARGSGSPVPESSYPAIATQRAKRFADSLARALPKTVAALDCLRTAGKRLALISNADALEGAGFAASPLASRLEVVVFSYEVGLVKPQPEIYSLCLSRLGVDAAQCVYVGDGGSDEFTGAREVGIPTICTTEFSRDTWPHLIPERAAKADVVIESLDQLCEAVTRAQ